MKFENEILSAAYTYHVPTLWMKAIITQESNWEPYALRYEPAYHYLYKADELARKYGTTLNTEIQGQKMSWGLGQLMGALCREQGHVGYLGELFEPIVNINMLALRLSNIMKYSDKPDNVFAMYNGGPSAWHEFNRNGRYPNQSYIDSVNKHLQA